MSTLSAFDALELDVQFAVFWSASPLRVVPSGKRSARNVVPRVVPTAAARLDCSAVLGTLPGNVSASDVVSLRQTKIPSSGKTTSLFWEAAVESPSFTQDVPLWKYVSQPVPL